MTLIIWSPRIQKAGAGKREGITTWGLTYVHGPEHLPGFRGTYFGSVLVLRGNSNYYLTKHDIDVGQRLIFEGRIKESKSLIPVFISSTLKTTKTWKCEI